MNQEQKSTETVLIVNPNSCSGLTGKNWETLYNQIKEIFGENPEVAFSQKSGDGTTLTRNFLRKKFNKIVALGGDGTINEVANGFFEEISLGNSSGNDQTTLASPILKPINPGAVMALVPSGTRNVLAKSLDLPEGIVECCQRFVNGKTRLASQSDEEQGNNIRINSLVNAIGKGIIYCFIWISPSILLDSGILRAIGEVHLSWPCTGSRPRFFTLKETILWAS